MTTPDVRSIPADLAEFRRRRRAEAIGRRGPASFVWGDFVTAPDRVVEGSAGRWSPLPDEAPGLLLRASAEDGITIGGMLVDGEAVLPYAGDYVDDDESAIARFPGGAEGVVFSYDGSKYALQVWNPRSEWASRYDDIAVFDWDPTWQVEATVTPVAEGRTVAITHHRDPVPVEVPVVAEVVFARDGVEHRLLATPGHPAGSLLLHFRDATSGAESYGAGRSLRVDTGAAAVTLDFNRATLLPCSFSLAWNCPLPPAENILAVPVRAGERNAVDVAGTILL